MSVDIEIIKDKYNKVVGLSVNDNIIMLEKQIYVLELCFNNQKSNYTYSYSENHLYRKLVDNINERLKVYTEVQNTSELDILFEKYPYFFKKDTGLYQLDRNLCDYINGKEILKIVFGIIKKLYNHEIMLTSYKIYHLTNIETDSLPDNDNQIANLFSLNENGNLEEQYSEKYNEYDSSCEDRSDCGNNFEDNNDYEVKNTPKNNCSLNEESDNDYCDDYIYENESYFAKKPKPVLENIHNYNIFGDDGDDM